MIRIQRPPTEPAALASARATGLANAAALPGAAGPLTTAPTPDPALGTAHQPAALVPTQTITGYQVARAGLHAAQHGKCCYCERYPEQKWQDTEHFRPKSSYWWLAWSWENLLFSCKSCNTAKLARFPLRAATCLQPNDPAPGSERPLLIDPAALSEADPLDHIQFSPIGAGRWRPFPRNGSRRGAALIRICALDRAPLRDQYRRQAAMMEDAVHRVQAAIDANNAAQIDDTWASVCRRWLAAHTPFAALHRDILDHHFPPRLRRGYGLALAIR